MSSLIDKTTTQKRKLEISGSEREEALLEEINDLKENNDCFTKALEFCNKEENKNVTITKFCNIDETECKAVKIMSPGYIAINNVVIAEKGIQLAKERNESIEAAKILLDQAKKVLQEMIANNRKSGGKQKKTKKRKNEKTKTEKRNQKNYINKS